MKKIILLILSSVILIYISLDFSFAFDYSNILSGSKSEILDALPNNSAHIISQTDDIETCLTELLNSTNTKSFITSSVRSLSKMLIVIMLGGICAGFQKNSELPVVTIATALAMTSVLFSDLQGMLSLCTETLEQTAVFSNTMLPVMAGAITLSGAPVTASATQSITMFALSLIIDFINSVLVPAICAYIAIITVNAALSNDLLDNLAQFIKWITTGSLKLILTIFIAYLSISGAISGSVDAVAIKTAKFAVSGSVPVVGGIISDATESMLAGMVTIKNSLGIIGMLGVTAICIIPFLKVGINYLIFKAGTAAFSPICNPSIRKLMAGIGDSLGLMLGMLGTCSAILFFELVFSILMVNPL